MRTRGYIERFYQKTLKRANKDQPQSGLSSFPFVDGGHPDPIFSFRPRQDTTIKTSHNELLSLAALPDCEPCGSPGRRRRRRRRRIFRIVHARGVIPREMEADERLRMTTAADLRMTGLLSRTLGEPAGQGGKRPCKQAKRVRPEGGCGVIPTFSMLIFY